MKSITPNIQDHFETTSSASRYVFHVESGARQVIAARLNRTHRPGLIIDLTRSPPQLLIHASSPRWLCSCTRTIDAFHTFEAADFWQGLTSSITMSRNRPRPRDNGLGNNEEMELWTRICQDIRKSKEKFDQQASLAVQIKGLVDRIAREGNSKCLDYPSCPKYALSTVPRKHARCSIYHAELG